MRYLDSKKRGKFIVIYGSNNVGKSVQFGLLAEKLAKNYHQQVLLLKYPIYGLEPTGPEIFQYTKTKNKESKTHHLTSLDLQKLYAKNRSDFQTILEQCLKAGVNVIAEDYVGTGLAWGLTYGVKLDELLDINKYLLEPDLSILLDGKRFRTGIEKKHIFENAGDEVWNKTREHFKKLAKKFKWKVVSSDNKAELVSENIMKMVIKELKLEEIKQ